MGRVARGNSSLQMRRKGALERLMTHVKEKHEEAGLKKHLTEIEKLKELVK